MFYKLIMPVFFLLLIASLLACSLPATSDVPSPDMVSPSAPVPDITLTPAPVILPSPEPTTLPFSTLPPATSPVPQQSPSPETTPSPAPDLPAIEDPLSAPSETPWEPFEFRTNEPTAYPVFACHTIMKGHMNITLEELALQQEDMTEDIILGPSQKIDCIDLVYLMEMLGDMEIPDTEALGVFDVLMDYSRALIELGFTQQLKVGDLDEVYSQEIDLFCTDEGAAGALQQTSQLNVDSMISDFNLPDLEFQSVDIDRDLSSLGADSVGTVTSIQFMGIQMTVYQLAVRHEKMLSIITTNDNNVISQREYEDNIDRIIALSKKAIERIRAGVENQEIFSPGPDTGRFCELLKLLPQESIRYKEEYLIMNDYAALRDMRGISIPNSSSPDSISDYLKDMYGLIDDYHQLLNNRFMASFMSGLGTYARSAPITLENVGFNLFSVDADIQISGETQTLNALLGRYDPAATARAMENRDKWPEAVRQSFTSENYGGITVYSWGDGCFDESLAFEPPHIDNQGRALPMAVTEHSLFYADSVTKIKSMINAGLTFSPSLAEVPEYRAAARGLSELGVFSGIIGNASIANSQDFLEDTGTARLLKHYRVFGTGIGSDLLGPYVALVLVHDTSEQAGKNAEILVDRVNHTSWTEPGQQEDSWRLYVDYMQVQAKGNVLYAKLYGDRGIDFWRTWLYEGYPFLLHE
ncbi:MAG: hypothetical protein JXA46_06765 [Dehalococcoidales bacterium]|nr:hypothetical protein [Dehalococcoidales bacterium]